MPGRFAADTADLLRPLREKPDDRRHDPHRRGDERHRGRGHDHRSGLRLQKANLGRRRAGFMPPRCAHASAELRHISAAMKDGRGARKAVTGKGLPPLRHRAWRRSIRVPGHLMGPEVHGLPAEAPPYRADIEFINSCWRPNEELTYKVCPSCNVE